MIDQLFLGTPIDYGNPHICSVTDPSPPWHLRGPSQTLPAAEQLAGGCYHEKGLVTMDMDEKWTFALLFLAKLLSQFLSTKHMGA